MIWLILACSGGEETLDSADCAEKTWYYYDADGDGFGNVDETVLECAIPAGYRAAYGDCNDLDPHANPEATETCNGRDDDCDGTADELASDAALWFPDADLDGFGVAIGAVNSCQQPSGYVDNDDDIDDTDATRYPGATESCDGLDNDGDGGIDESGAIGESTYFLDADGDGFGDSNLSLVACDAPATYVSNDQDCDDSQPDIFPEAPEPNCADPIDYNCDGSVAYADADLDGFAACADCNDADAAQNPAGIEVCNEIDDDCDHSIDEGATDTLICYNDLDADSFGAGVALTACEQPSGAVPNATDCDDTDAAVAPSADEFCNGADDNCDGAIDDNPIDGNTTWTDSDGDSYGDPDSATSGCDPLSTGVANGDDCNDTDEWVFPGAPESCNDYDDDCDAEIDEAGSQAESTFYADHDSDGFGEAATTVSACAAPAGWVADATDCDDYDAGTNPGAGETCDGEDDDCDALVDEDAATDAPTWYLDVDSDGFGGLNGTWVSCEAPPGHAATADDCDDNDPFTYPGAAELCDGKATDCDDSSWVNDGGIVSFYSDATEEWTDWSGTFATGAPGFPVEIDVPEDGQLSVCSGTYYTSIVVDSYLDVRLTGPEGAESTVLDGGDSARVLEVGGGGQTAIEGLTVQNGYAGYGGGLYVAETYVTLGTIRNSVFRDNTAFADGGAMWLGNSYAVYGFDDVLFEGNTAGSRGGAICIGCSGGGYSTLALTGVELTDNAASYGGAVYALYDVDVLATGIVATDNDATASGGVFAAVNASSFWIEASEMAGNEASNGGVVYLGGGSVEFDGSDVHDNVAYGTGGVVYAYSSAGSSIYVVETSMYDNVAYASAGALYLYNSSGYCVGHTGADDVGIYGNEAVGGSGSDIYVSSTGYFDASLCDLRDPRDNSDGEVYHGGTDTTYTFGTDAEFACDPTSCL